MDIPVLGTRNRIQQHEIEIHFYFTPTWTHSSESEVTHPGDQRQQAKAAALPNLAAGYAGGISASGTPRLAVGRRIPIHAPVRCRLNLMRLARPRAKTQLMAARGPGDGRSTFAGAGSGSGLWMPPGPALRSNSMPIVSASLGAGLARLGERFSECRCQVFRIVHRRVT